MHLPEQSLSGGSLGGLSGILSTPWKPLIED